ncbi:unnamed protein product, partial [Protopolystoma xenopodis]
MPIDCLAGGWSVGRSENGQTRLGLNLYGTLCQRRSRMGIFQLPNPAPGSVYRSLRPTGKRLLSTSSGAIRQCWLRSPEDQGDCITDGSHAECVHGLCESDSWAVKTTGTCKPTSSLWERSVAYQPVNACACGSTLHFEEM